MAEMTVGWRVDQSALCSAVRSVEAKAEQTAELRVESKAYWRGHMWVDQTAAPMVVSMAGRTAAPTVDSKVDM